MVRPVLRVGIDLSGLGFDEIRRAAEAAGVAQQLRLVTADANDFDGGQFDLVLCIGSTHAFGGLSATLDAIRAHLAPGGLALVGEAFWEREPSPETLAALGQPVEDYDSLAGTVDRVVGLGWIPLEAHVSSLAQWDAYEWSWTGSLARWALEKPEDPSTLW